jgi:hypothetical protein
MIRKLVAIQFVRFMTAGRTFPALLGCEDESGTTVGEYVVKLRGTVGEPGLMKDSSRPGSQAISAWPHLCRRWS